MPKGRLTRTLVRGFANGVVDLEYGELLFAKSARKLLVSRVEESRYTPTTR